MMLEKTGDTEGLQKAKETLKTRQQALKQYCTDNDLKYKPDRTAVVDYKKSVSGFTPSDEKNRIAEIKAKAVDKTGGSGIIKVRGGDMYRKHYLDKIEPMPKKQFRKIEKHFKANGGIIQYNEETDAYLKSKNAEAITYNEKTILLKQNPSRASVFEELIHATQYRNGENDGSYINRLKCEISAQKKLIKYSKAFKLTNNEIIQTKKALAAYEKELSEYIKNGGV